MSERHPDTIGTIGGKLSIEIAGNKINLGYIQVPVTGFPDGPSPRLSANLYAVKDAVQEIFNQSTHTETHQEDES